MQFQWVKMKIIFRIFQDRLDIWRLWKVKTNIMNILLQKGAKMKISILQELRPLNYLLSLNQLMYLHNQHRLMFHRSLNHLILIHILNLQIYLQNPNHHTFHLFRHILNNSVPSSLKANFLIMNQKNKECNSNFRKTYQIKISQYKDGLK